MADINLTLNLFSSHLAHFPTSLWTIILSTFYLPVIVVVVAMVVVMKDVGSGSKTGLVVLVLFLSYP